MSPIFCVAVSVLVILQLLPKCLAFSPLSGDLILVGEQLSSLEKDTTHSFPISLPRALRVCLWNPVTGTSVDGLLTTDGGQRPLGLGAFQMRTLQEFAQS